MPSSTCSFSLLYPLFSLRSSSSFLHLLPLLPVTSVVSSIFALTTCLTKQFLRKTWLINLAFLQSTVCGIFLSNLTLRYTSYLTRWFQLIFSILLEHQISNIPEISDLLSEVFNFQHHTKLCSKCSSLLVCSLNWSPICWWKEPFSCWMLLFHGDPGFNFMCTSYIICYHIAQIAEIFHIFQLCFMYHNLYQGWLPGDSYYLSFIHVHFHSTASSTIN